MRLLCACAAACCALYAQESIHRATVSGRVTDASGAGIPEARVSARALETNATSASVTDSEGRFRFAYLAPGRYEIDVEKSGFAKQARIVMLGMGSAFDLAFTLGIASAQASVVVTSDAPVLEGARTQMASTLSHPELQQLPLNGRNFLDAALLSPGVSATNTASNQLFAESSAVPGQGLSIGSQRNFSNGFLVDGLSDNDDASGLTGALYSLDAIEQLQVVTSGGQPEYGRALGGYVSVATRSGGNRMEGDAYGFFRNTALNAANSLLQAKLPMTQAQYGASLGGPVVRNRTFYFANFERRDLNQSGLTTISPANAAIINAHLLAVGYPGPQVATGIYPNPVHSTNVFAKLDHQFSDADRFSVRYSAYRVSSINSRGAGGLSAPSASADLYDTDQVVAASNILTLSPRALNETRSEFWNSNLAAPPSDAIGPAVSIAGVASFGTLSGSPTARRNRLGQLVDNFSYEAGGHSIRVGAEFLENDDTIVFPRSYRGSYSFASLANFLAGTYNASGFTQTFANSSAHQTNPNVGLYAQDEWTVAPSLTLNFGLRYDLEFLRTIVTETDNISPRAGFAWTPFASRRTVIRGGYGLFYDRIPLRPLANALLSANNTTDPAELSQISISLSPAQAGAPVFPNILSSLTLPPGVLFNFSTMDRHIRNAYSEQGHFEIEQQLGKNATLSVGYQHVRGLRLLASVNQNVPTCAASGGNNGCRPNPAYGNDSQYSAAGDSHYDALVVSFVERPVSWGDLRVSYTYSKALDDVGEFFFSAPLNNYNIWQDYGRSDDDQRHRVAVSGSVRSPIWGLSLSAMLLYDSALPFNITTGANTVQGTAARPVVNGAYIPRNAGNGFDSFTLSARLSRWFTLSDRVKLEALVEGFNLTNRVNGVSLNGVFGTGSYPANPSPTYRGVTAVGDPRGFQFGLRAAF